MSNRSQRQLPLWRQCARPMKSLHFFSVAPRIMKMSVSDLYRPNFCLDSFSRWINAVISIAALYSKLMECDCCQFLSLLLGGSPLSRTLLSLELLQPVIAGYWQLDCSLKTTTAYLYIVLFGLRIKMWLIRFTDSFWHLPLQLLSTLSSTTDSLRQHV